MTDAQKAAMEWVDYWDIKLPGPGGNNARTLKAMLAEPRLPAKVHLDCMPETTRYTMTEWDIVVDAIRFYHDALYAHLTRPHVDFAALDEARMDDDSADAGVSPRTSTAKQAELRKAISVLRGWSAEAAGRTGLAASVLIVCNAAEATLPVQMYRVRNGAALDVICPGPISISEVDNA